MNDWKIIKTIEGNNMTVRYRRVSNGIEVAIFDNGGIFQDHIYQYSTNYFNILMKIGEELK